MSERVRKDVAPRVKCFHPPQPKSLKPSAALHFHTQIDWNKPFMRWRRTPSHPSCLLLLADLRSRIVSVSAVLHMVCQSMQSDVDCRKLNSWPNQRQASHCVSRVSNGRPADSYSFFHRDYSFHSGTVQRMSRDIRLCLISRTWNSSI